MNIEKRKKQLRSAYDRLKMKSFLPSLPNVGVEKLIAEVEGNLNCNFEKDTPPADIAAVIISYYLLSSTTAAQVNMIHLYYLSTLLEGVLRDLVVKSNDLKKFPLVIRGIYLDVLGGMGLNQKW